MAVVIANIQCHEKRWSNYFYAFKTRDPLLEVGGWPLVWYVENVWWLKKKREKFGLKNVPSHEEGIQKGCFIVNVFEILTVVFTYVRKSVKMWFFKRYRYTFINVHMNNPILSSNYIILQTVDILATALEISCVGDLERSLYVLYDCVFLTK